MFAASPAYARDVIKSFNEMGFDALNPKWSGADHAGSAPRYVSISAESPKARRASSVSRSPRGV
ncbi:hypothetical protein [Actinopolymorpha sp. B9G3]|uniref:hypothetical protein n=1 Tax=Actinopolymorpha sp. B9G3 TaxID=3158970 RepID=UPI0032D96B10